MSPIDPATGQEVNFKGKASRLYTGSTTDLKRRVGEHRTTFKPSVKASKKKTIDQLNATKRKASGLAAHIWELKGSGLSYAIDWHIQHRSSVYKPGDNWCGICLSETTVICYSDPEVSLNK